MANDGDRNQQPGARSRRNGMRLAMLGAAAGAAALAVTSLTQAPEEMADAPEAPQTTQASLSAGAPTTQSSGGAPAGGEPPWRRFAVPDDSEIADPRVQSGAPARPVIALVIAPYKGSLGEVDRIDAPLTVVLPEGGEAAHAARARGHEALLDLASAGRSGDVARDAAAALEARVQTGLPHTENERRIGRKIAAGDGYVGLAVIGDAEAAADPQLLRTVFRKAAKEGLLVLDGRASNETKGYLIKRATDGPSTTVQVVIDAERDPEAMAEALSLAEEIARERGGCVALAHAHPETLAAIETWLADRDQSQPRLAPLTALVRAGF